MKSQGSINLFSYYFHLSIERKTLKRSIWVAIVVGVILNLINSPGLFLNFSFQEINLLKITLTFLVPYLVSTYSSVLSNSSLKPDGIAHFDAILKCKSCNKTQFQARIGEKIDKCPSCNEKTRWVPIKFLSPIFTNDETLESLALFARYNPQPLFRLDSTGIILNSNLASDALFDIESPIGENLIRLFPELQELNFNQIINEGEVRKIMVSVDGKFFNMVFKGVSMLSNIHVYGNDITRVIMNDIKIKDQAKAINESIQYSLFIQKAMLPDIDLLKKILPVNFVFNKPRDIVSGDFYWINEIGELKIVVVADSTGHGVPGALMSMIGISMLNEIILREKMYEPEVILDCLRERIILSLSSGTEDSNISDGWDMAIAVINTEKNIVCFSGAYNPLYIYRNNEIHILEADRMPARKHVKDKSPFTVKTMEIFPDDRFYLFTDGYKDQFGGEKNKKFSSRAFHSLIQQLGEIPFEDQFDVLNDTFNSWKLENDQVDDVLVMGFKVD